MSILDKATRHRVYLDGRVLPDPTGRIVMIDDPVLLALAEYYEAFDEFYHYDGKDYKSNEDAIRIIRRQRAARETMNKLRIENELYSCI